MRHLGFALLLPVTLLAVPAQAIGPIHFKNGVVRVIGGAAEAKNRSFVMRGQSLTLVLPGGAVIPQNFKTDDALIREIRFSGKGNRTELEVRLADRVEKYLSQMTLKSDKKDLILHFRGTNGSVENNETPESAIPASETAASAQKNDSNTKARFSGNDPSAKVAGQINAPNSAPNSALGLWPKSDSMGMLNGKTTSSSGGSSWYVFMMGIIIIGGVAWWVKFKKKSILPQSPHINIVSTRALSTKHRLIMVDVAGEMLLLGTTDKDIRMLRAIHRKAEANRSNQDDNGDPSPTSENSSGKKTLHDLLLIKNRAQAKGVNTEAEGLSGKPVHASINGQHETIHFMDRLAQRLQKPQLQQEKKEEELQPLDERWAEGILKLRRAQRSDSTPTTASTDILH